MPLKKKRRGGGGKKERKVMRVFGDLLDVSLFRKDLSDLFYLVKTCREKILFSLVDPPNISYREL